MFETDFIRGAKAERQRLFVMLRDNSSDFRKYIALRELLAAYGDSLEDEIKVAVIVASPRNGDSNASKSRPGSKASLVEAAAERWFSRVQRRAQSLEIMRALEAEGLEFKGEKPTAALASILSHSDRFDNVRGEGYGLRAWSQSVAARQSTQSIDSATTGRAEPQTAAPESGTAADKLSAKGPMLPGEEPQAERSTPYR